MGLLLGGLEVEIYMAMLWEVDENGMSRTHTLLAENVRKTAGQATICALPLLTS